MTLEQMLREFHTKLRPHQGLMPETPTAAIPADVQKLRDKLLAEELRELADAYEAGDIVEIADAICDCIYLLAGDAIVCGIPLDRALAEVHRSNLTKTNDPAAEKLVKGPGYEPPDIAGVLGLSPYEDDCRASHCPPAGSLECVYPECTR